MKNLKTFENFKTSKPSVDSDKKITITEDESRLFKSEPVLQKLISDDKVSLVGNEVHYDNEETKSILDEYFEI